MKIKPKELFLYGKLRPKNKAALYCELHKCYLDKGDVKKKGCNFKNCKYRKEITW